MRTPRPLTVLAAVAAATTLGVVLAGPASAAREVHRDPAGDTTAVELPDSPRLRPADEADIVRIATTYAQNRVTVTTDLVDIADDDWTVGVVLRTAAGTSFLNYRDVDGEPPSVTFSPPAPRRVAHAGQTECAPVADLARRQNRLTLSIDSRCAGAQQWVRSGVGAARLLSTTRVRADDARRVGRVSLRGMGLKLGPKVRRN